MTTTTLPADKFDTAMTFVKPDPAPTRVPLDKLAVLPGFNTRVKDADYNERVAAIAESIAANGFFDDKPFAVTMLPDDETVYVYDGEHRFDAAKQALLDGAEFPDGLPVAWAKDGATVKDLTIHLAHGNNGERLNMVELAAVVRRMQGLGMDKPEIAAALGRTARHIDNLFVLAGANQQVKKAVASGKIAGAEAVKLLRKDKTTAAAKIAEAVKKAEEKGKAKATPKTMKADGPAETRRKMTTAQMSISFPTGSKMGDNLKSLAGMIREALDIGEGDVLNDENVLIRFSVAKVDKAAEAEAAAKAKEREEAAAAKAKEREEKAAAKAAEKKAADEKRAAEKKLLAEAAKKGSDAKKPATKKAATAKKTPAEAKAAAKAHLSGDKAPSEAKPRRRAQKPAESDSGAAATSGAQTAESTPSGADGGESGASAMTDESMGGL